MRQKIPICKTFTNDSLLKTAIKRFPEYKSYIQSFMIGKCVCISKKSLFRVVIKVSHGLKKRTTTLGVTNNATVLGLYWQDLFGIMLLIVSSKKMKTFILKS